MNRELQHEVQHLQAILQRHGQSFDTVSGATKQNIDLVERTVGITFDHHLREFYEFTNGSDNELWFAVYSDQLTPCAFPSLAEAQEAWSWFEPYDQAVYDEWSDREAERDSRIQPSYLHHRAWFPIAEFNGFSTTVYFDADPTSRGSYGQIIVYQHDPDAIYYVADNFLAFLKASNRLLEQHGADIL
jgi:cell wall assembly regulator SMI1